MRVYLKTFGCRANQYDTEAVRSLLIRGGCEITDAATGADVAIFNSCAVTADAVADLRQSVRRAARENQSLRTLIMGCASALSDAEALRALPTVTDVLPGADLDGVASALALEALADAPRTTSQMGARGLLRIQDGCDEHCTFCATTLARGANRSRPIDQLGREAEVLAEHHREIVITGVHIGTYGRDIGTTLSALIDHLVITVPNARFRLTSIEATEVDDRLIEIMRSGPRSLAPSIHAPLQSGSDLMLKRMGRHWYTSASYRAAIVKTVSRLGLLGLGADIITGFPGETDGDHRATVAIAEELPFTYLHVFPFSERPGTAALNLPHRVSGSLARARAAELREIGDRKAKAYLTSRIGQVADVVGIGARRGLTEDYLEIDTRGEVARGERRTLRIGR